MVLTVACGLGLVASYFTAGNVAVMVSIACGSVFAVKTMLESLRARQLDVNLLMVLAAIGAVLVGQPREAAVLLFLFSLSSALEEMAMAKTEAAIGALVKLRPATALRVQADGTHEVPLEEVAVGDVVRLNPFSIVPLDGVLLGESSFNEAAISGESQPVHKIAGDNAIAGTQNLGTRADVRVTAAAGNTTLDRIVRLVEEAQEKPTSGERISRWFAATYTAFVLAVALISFAVRFFGLHETVAQAGYHSLILLVALSPCALVISAPAAALSALAFAARRGILVRGGLALEQAGMVTAVNLDKTGTLTTGKFDVAEVCVLHEPIVECWRPGSRPNEAVLEVLRLVASTESASQHPIAVAILDFARRTAVEWPEPQNVEVVPGKGLRAVVGGISTKVGQLSFFEPAELGHELNEHAAEMGERGLTVVVVSAGDVQAALGLRDTPRADAPELLSGFRKLGIGHIRMLTGDNAKTAHAVAKELGLQEFEAGMTPERKHELVQQQVRQGEIVMMVGDGVNDAPALAEAHVGVAMGGLGNEVALEVADVVLVQDRIQRLPLLVALGRKTRANIRFNLWFAGGMIAALTLGSLVGWVPLSWAVLGHEGSTALVVLNGLRLLGGAGAERMLE